MKKSETKKWNVEFVKPPLSTYQNGHYVIRDGEQGVPFAILPEGIGGKQDKNGKNSYQKKKVLLVTKAPELVECLNDILANTAWIHIGGATLNKALRLIKDCTGKVYSTKNINKKEK